MTTPELESSVVQLPAAGDEIENLLGALDRNRETFAWKCFGLDAADMRRTLAPSTLTLAGLVKHMSFVEDYYFTLRLEATMPAPWDAVDWDADPEYPWISAMQDSPEELQTLWETVVERSRAATAAAVSRGDLGQPVRYSDWDETPNLRRTVVDMLEEYARHTGHADLIRESIDGLVGEERPR
jgi:Protein of unknown function (DUF664)